MLFSLILIGFFFQINSIYAQTQSSDWSTTRPQYAASVQYINACNEPFYHGVASGDPLFDRVIIWTRVTPIDSSNNPLMVHWEMATDLLFTNIIQSDSLSTDPSRDYTVKVDVTNLNSNSYYYYRFKTGTQYSMVGRTKTSPLNWVNQLRLGVVSCSDYRQGYFTAYRKLAARNDLDAVVHLGDYIYEGTGGPSNRLHEPNIEVYRLQDYRSRLSQYHLDPDLMRCHQMHPFVIIWDDHDIVVDALRDTSYRHNAAVHGLYSDRKYAAVKAMREWLPIRDDTSEFFKNWKRLPFGNLLDLYAIDVRLYDRDRFVASVSDSLYGDPNHRLLGPVQMNWINSQLDSTTARWKVIANQLMVAHLGVFGTPVVFENWDGYPVERTTFYNNLKDNNIDNVLFVTGDFHCSFANDLCDLSTNPAYYDPQTGAGSVATEFVVPSITGDNFDEGNTFGFTSAEQAVTLLQLSNPHVHYAELTSHGYILLDIDSSRAQAEFWYMDNIKDPYNNGEYLAKIYKTEHAANHVVEDSVASLPKTNIPLAPPADTCNTINTEIIAQNFPIVLSVAPNPFDQFVMLNYVLNQVHDLKISVYTSQGQLVHSKRFDQQNKGNHNYYLSTDDWPKGSYYLQLETTDYRHVMRLIKVE